jgi:hypothetical protein
MACGLRGTENGGGVISQFDCGNRLARRAPCHGLGRDLRLVRDGVPLLGREPAAGAGSVHVHQIVGSLGTQSGGQLVAGRGCLALRRIDVLILPIGGGHAANQCAG